MENEYKNRFNPLSIFENSDVIVDVVNDSKMNLKKDFDKAGDSAAPSTPAAPEVSEAAADTADSANSASVAGSANSAVAGSADSTSVTGSADSASVTGSANSAVAADQASVAAAATAADASTPATSAASDTPASDDSAADTPASNESASDTPASDTPTPDEPTSNDPASNADQDNNEQPDNANRSMYSSWQPILQPKNVSEKTDGDNVKFERIFLASETIQKGSAVSHQQQPHTYNFYKESIKAKTKKKRPGVLKYVVVSFLSAAFGVAVTFLALLYLSYYANSNGFLMSASPLPKPDVASVVKQFEFDVIDSPVQAIYEKVSPSVVGIRVVSTYNTFFFGEQNISGEGSGVIIREDGYILTNNHVIAGDSSNFGQFPSGGNQSNEYTSRIEVILPDDKTTSYPAIIVGRDSKTDLAVLKIDRVNLPAAELGDSDALKPGELAVAIGNPGGLEYMSSVTDGVISGLDRHVQTEDGKEYNLIQTNAALNTGNSGGALANSRGQVIGINTIKVFQTGYEGLGFAIPINAAKEVAQNLIDFNYVKGRAKIGIKYNTEFNDNYEYYRKQYDVPKGVLVVEVEPLSGAFKAGIMQGDIITRFNDVLIEDYTDLITVKDSLTPGDVIPVEVYRDKKKVSMDLELSEDIGEYVQN